MVDAKTKLADHFDVYPLTHAHHIINFWNYISGHNRGSTYSALTWWFYVYITVFSFKHHQHTEDTVEQIGNHFNNYVTCGKATSKVLQKEEQRTTKMYLNNMTDCKTLRTFKDLGSKIERNEMWNTGLLIPITTKIFSTHSTDSVFHPWHLNKRRQAFIKDNQTFQCHTVAITNNNNAICLFHA